MCGIFGINRILEDRKIIDILNLTRHRGPDNLSYSYVNNWTFGHNRLSIIDLSSDANQPFVSTCGNYLIVFNGEIYNFLELKKRLEGKYKFKTNSDTEVLLNIYIEKGEECLKYLRGMFAFAIYDKKKNKLFCARDRLGIKPFIYTYQNGTFVFASEIKPILKVLGYTPNLNYEALLQYLHYLYIPYPNTIFEGIFKLPPAHYLVFENGKLKMEKYWDITNFANKNEDLSENEILEKLDSILNDSVKLRMIADVELGSFLSGGMDSSTILYYMQKNSTKPINTFTLSFPDLNKYDESKDATLIAEYFGTNHNIIEINPKIVELLPKMVHHFDEPFGNPTSLLIYELTKETKKYATVALAGDGGDEVFGGYPRHKAVLLSEKLNFLPSSFWSVVSKIINFLPEDTSGNHIYRRLKTFINSLTLEYSERYDSWVSYFSNNELKNLLKIKIDYNQVVKSEWTGLKIDDTLLKALIVDLKTFLPNNLLTYGDAMSMANSFEVRFPLIDHVLVEFMVSIKSDYKIRKGVGKYILKVLMKDKLPQEIIRKPKRGLNPPMGIWIKKDLKTIIDIYLSKNSVEKRGILNYNFVRYLIDEHMSNKRDRSLHIWSLIVLEEWFRQYID